MLHQQTHNTMKTQIPNTVANEFCTQIDVFFPGSFVSATQGDFHTTVEVVGIDEEDFDNFEKTFCHENI